MRQRCSNSFGRHRMSDVVGVLDNLLGGLTADSDGVPAARAEGTTDDSAIDDFGSSVVDGVDLRLKKYETI